jgi:hypothetical protein
MVSTTRTPPLGAKAHSGLRGILHGPRKASPAAWLDVKPDVNTRVKAAVKSQTGDKGGRGGNLDVGGYPWSEGQGGYLDGEQSDLLTYALTTLVGKQNDEAFGEITMDTQWKQAKRITLGSIKTLEDLTTRFEDFRYSDTTLLQTVSTNLE